MMMCRVFAVVAILAMLLGANGRNAHADNADGITVMTQNVYQGTELEHAIAATSLPELLTGVATDYNNVIATNFAQRADALAAEIGQSGPALVGLQEVALWRTQSPYNPVSPPQTVSYDFLRILLDALAARGLHYTAVLTHDNYDLSAAGAFPVGLMGVRLTDRTAILARTDLPADQLTVSNPQQGTYLHINVLQTIIGSLPLSAGWLSVDVSTRGKTFRFITTHLGPFSPAVMEQQAQELLDGPAATDLPVVLAGDLNTVTTDPAYSKLTAAGFTDEWPVANPDDTGATAFQVPPDSIVNPVSNLHSRIDYVMARGLVSPLELHLVGADPSSRTVSGLWPSDHAGIVARLQIGVVGAPSVASVAGMPSARTASFTVSFYSSVSGQGEVYFGSGPGCAGLVQTATRDLHPGTTLHSVVVTGNDLPGTVGNNGIQPGATYWYETVNITRSGTQIDNNNGACYSVTIPRK